MYHKNKPFQSHDIAAIAIPPGAIGGWEPGLGKTRKGLLYALLKCGYTVDRHKNICPNAPALFVMPPGLHKQFMTEAESMFRIRMIPLDSKETFLHLSTLNPHRPVGTTSSAPIKCLFDPTLADLAAHSFVCVVVDEGTKMKGDQTKISLGVRTLQPPHRLVLSGTPIKNRVPDVFHLASWVAGAFDPGSSVTLAARLLEPAFYITSYTALGTNGVRKFPTAADLAEDVPAALELLCVKPHEIRDQYLEEYNAIAEEIRNDYYRKDKVVRLQDLDLAFGDEPAPREFSKLTLALRHQFTVQKLCHLLKDYSANLGDYGSSKTGSSVTLAGARFPYTPEEKSAFAETFCVSENTISERGGLVTSRTKLTPQVCNVHRLWKLMAPLILRRRKKDIGQDLVPKHNHIIRVPLGTLQRQLYAEHIHWQPKDCHNQTATGKKLQGLRMAAAYPPSSPLYHRFQDILRTGDYDKFLSPDNREYYRSADSPVRSTSAHLCPKDLSELKLIDQILARGEQWILFCPFIDPLTALSARLNHAGVPHHVLTGDTSPAKRGRIAAEFQKGPAKNGSTGLLVSGCMSEGYSFYKCNNVILHSYDWAMDMMLQVIDRAHRLNSEKAVNIYRLITEGTIDRRLEQQLDEKSDSSELILDGHLLGEQKQEMNLRELLEEAIHEFSQTGTDTIAETFLEKEWDPLALSLRKRMQTWPLGCSVTLPRPQGATLWLERLRARTTSKTQTFTPDKNQLQLIAA